MRSLFLCAAVAASGCASTGRSTPDSVDAAAAAEAAEDCSAVCGGSWVVDGGCTHNLGCPSDYSEQCGDTWLQCCAECLPPLPDGELYL
jgi:hypothetical protein